MNKTVHNALNCINEGIILLDENLDILYVNNYMTYLTGIMLDNVFSMNLYEVFPSLNKKYFKDSMKTVVRDGCKIFFSAAMHRDLIATDQKLNLKISKVESYDKDVILMEFINVTSQFFRINQLKDYVDQLCKLNRELKEKEKVIRKLAYYDNLTGVANRMLFYELSEKILNRIKRTGGLLGLMFIDVNKFKGIKDTHGHEIGDKVLTKVAAILTEATRKNDVVARYGGDEFLVLIPDIKKIDNYKAIVSRIINSKKNIIVNNREEINISLSIGVSFYPNDGDSVDDLIIKADKAMYIAKNKSAEDSFSCSG